MKIFLVTDEMGMKGIPGGGMNHMMYIARPARKLGHEVEYMTADVLTAPGGGYTDVRKKALIDEFKRRVVEFDADIIVAFNFCLWGKEVIEAADELGIPIVLTVPDYMMVCKNRSLIYFDQPSMDICDLTFSKCSDCTDLRMGIGDFQEFAKLAYTKPMIVASNFIKKAFVMGGVPEENITMIEYGLNPNDFKPVYGGNSGQIANISRISPEKGLGEYDKIASMLPELKFILAGYPIRNMKDTSFEYIGAVTEKEKKYLLQSSEMFVSTPIWYEPAGGTYLEAKACGKPVVAFGMGGIRQYNDDTRSSRLFNLRDFDGMSEEIKRLHNDEEERINMGKIGRKQIEERNNENVLIHKNMEVYERAIGVR